MPVGQLIMTHPVYACKSTVGVKKFHFSGSPGVRVTAGTTTYAGGNELRGRPDSSGQGSVTASLPDAGMKVKVCGIVDRAELDVLAAAEVDLAGLWYGVTDGPHDLGLERLVELAAPAAVRPAAVLVTFGKDPGLLAEALVASAIGSIQLHGYQSPGLVRRLKARVPEVTVLKVLHIRGGECLEGSLLGAYEKAGTDAFLLDVVTEDGRVGSTGIALDPGIASSIAESFHLPFLIAGGISDDNRERYAALSEHPRFVGVDVDTSARGSDGRISAHRVDAITHAWRADG
jgi:phosphoribosylanthranilate isomerase